jgi:dTDP-4-amino-4,6-dideoxygalactose transaminase
VRNTKAAPPERSATPAVYPGKNLGAYGEAGAIVTNDAGLAAKLRKFRDHGQDKKYYHSLIGWNARMDGIQGAVLGVKLGHLNQWNEARRKNARLYDELLAGLPLWHPLSRAGAFAGSLSFSRAATRQLSRR